MKYLILLGFFSLSQATFFNFFRKPEADVVQEPERVEYLNPEDIKLYNQIYSTNGYGYYPQLNYPTFYQIPIQGVSPIVTHLPAVFANRQPIVVPEKAVHTEYATPIEYTPPVHEEELPSPNPPVNYNNGAYLTETHPTELHLTPQIDGLPGQYSHSYILSDGTKVFEEGHLKQSNAGNEILVKSGNYEYIKQNGEVHKVNWIADEDGFRVLE